jgi:hypothetical protein
LINLELEQNNFLEAENNRSHSIYPKTAISKKENSSLSFKKETKKNITI